MIHGGAGRRQVVATTLLRIDGDTFLSLVGQGVATAASWAGAWGCGSRISGGRELR